MSVHVEDQVEVSRFVLDPLWVGGFELAAMMIELTIDRTMEEIHFNSIAGLVKPTAIDFVMQTQ